MRLTDASLGGTSALWASGPRGFGEDGTGCRLMNTLPGASVRAMSTSARSHGNEQHPPRSRFTVHSLERQTTRRGREGVKKLHSSAASAGGLISRIRG